MNTTPIHISGELTGMFEASRHGNGLSFEELRHNYSVSAKMNNSDDTSIGGINIAPNGNARDALSGDDKDKQAARDFLLMSMLNDIDAMEANLADKYGEDFAENLAAEHLDEETYMRLMLIDEQGERRKQIAIELQRGIENGTIDADAIENPDFKEWIEVRAADVQNRANLDLSDKTDLDVTENTSESDYAVPEKINLSTGLNNLFG
jgi:hypothetical protein